MFLAYISTSLGPLQETQLIGCGRHARGMHMCSIGIVMLQIVIGITTVKISEHKDITLYSYMSITRLTIKPTGIIIAT